MDKIYKKTGSCYHFESANQQKRGLQIAEKHKTKVGSYVTFQVFAQNLIHTATFWEIIFSAHPAVIHKKRP